MRRLHLANKASASIDVPVEFTEAGEAKWTWKATLTVADSKRIFRDAVESKLNINYPAPLKGSKPQNMKLLNWAFPGGTLLEPFGEDIRSRIIETFSRHGKQISSEVYDKVNNTEALLKHCKAAKQAWDTQNVPRKSQ